MTDPAFDFGGGYTGRPIAWAPDRDLNPQYADVPDHPFVALALTCGPHGAEGAVTLDRGIPGQREEAWTVQQEDPLTLSPSIAAPCGCHGFIIDGRWVDA